MKLKVKLFRYFFPAVLSFFVLVGLAAIPSVQKWYCPIFKDFILVAASSGQSTIYFKIKEANKKNAGISNNVVVLFNSKAYLQSLIEQAKATGKKGAYDYKGFEITVTDYFTTPLLFFFCLLLYTPSALHQKLLSLLMGSAAIIGFAYLTIQFKSFHMVAESGIMDYSTNQATFYELLAYVFSNVATITVALLAWILLAFRESTLQLFIAK